MVHDDIDERVEELSDDQLDELMLHIITDAGPEGISTFDIKKEIRKRLKAPDLATLLGRLEEE